MDLRINSKSHVPVHVQLEGQIKHLILTGNFEVGSRLPSIRAMAGFLRVNRNTVARVFSDLEREGYVESRRGSGVYVVEPPVEAEDLKRQEVLERVMDLAAAQDVPVEDLAYALLARAGAKPQEKTPHPLRRMHAGGAGSVLRRARGSAPRRGREGLDRGPRRQGLGRGGPAVAARRDDVLPHPRGAGHSGAARHRGGRATGRSDAGEPAEAHGASVGDSGRGRGTGAARAWRTSHAPSRVRASTTSTSSRSTWRRSRGRAGHPRQSRES